MSPLPVHLRSNILFLTALIGECIRVCVHRRKRGEKGEVVETVEDVIVRRLTVERIEELKRLIKDTQEKHRYTFSHLLGPSPAVC